MSVTKLCSRGETISHSREDGNILIADKNMLFNNTFFQNLKVGIKYPRCSSPCDTRQRSCISSSPVNLVYKLENIYKLRFSSAVRAISF